MGTDFKSDMLYTHLVNITRAAKLPTGQDVLNRLKIILESSIHPSHLPPSWAAYEADRLIEEIFIQGIIAEIKYQTKNPNHFVHEVKE